MRLLVNSHLRMFPLIKGRVGGRGTDTGPGMDPATQVRALDWESALRRAGRRSDRWDSGQDGLRALTPASRCPELPAGRLCPLEPQSQALRRQPRLGKPRGRGERPFVPRGRGLPWASRGPQRLTAAHMPLTWGVFPSHPAPKPAPAGSSRGTKPQALITSPAFSEKLLCGSCRPDKRRRQGRERPRGPDARRVSSRTEVAPAVPQGRSRASQPRVNLPARRPRVPADSRALSSRTPASSHGLETRCPASGGRGK